MPAFVSETSENEPIVIHGSGSQIRAFCHVSNIANGISLTIDNGDNEIMNIGYDAELITIFELAKKIVNITNSKSNIQFVPFINSNRKRRREIISRIPDIRKARRILSYEPRISLNDGIISVLKGEKHALSG